MSTARSRFNKVTQKEPRFKKKVLRILAYMGGGGLALLLGIFVGFQIWSPFVIKRFNAVLASTANNTLILDYKDRLVTAIEGVEDRHNISIDKVSPLLQKGIVAIEDRRFFSHRGLDPVRLLGAIVVNLQNLTYRQGASTITQQLVKLSLLSSERTLSRKLKEVFMSLALEQEYTKLKILEFYLNRVYLGHGLYGVEKASQIYFKKPASQLNLMEASFLAALVKKPEGYLTYEATEADKKAPYLPYKKLIRLRKRQNQVLASMLELGWTTEAEVKKALALPFVIHKPASALTKAPYFAQQVLKELKSVLGIPQVSGRGYRVHTSLDIDSQNAAEELISQIPSEKRKISQAALVSLDVKTGEVRALVGGVNFNESEFNRATLAKRQPGSAFKPILYAAALESGLAPNAVFVDEPVRYMWSGGKLTRLTGDSEMVLNQLDEALAESGEIVDVYEPRNYNNRYGSREGRMIVTGGGDPVEMADGDKRMTLTRALELSSNVIAVKLLDKLGHGVVTDLAKSLGLDVRPQMGLCVALGCSETTLLDLTAAYGAFPRGGGRLNPVFIRKVTNFNGDLIYEHTPSIPVEVMTPFTAFQITHMMTGVVQRGTGRRARLSRPVGGKTGTNDGPRDAWFVGFTPSVVTGVWVGNDDNTFMLRESGGGTPATIWRKFMSKTLPPYDGMEFPAPPEEFVVVKTCTITGEVANEYCPSPQLYNYRTSEIPESVCTLHPNTGEFTGELGKSVV